MRSLLSPKTIAHALLSVSLLAVLVGHSIAETVPLASGQLALLAVVDQPDIHPKHRVLADRVLRLLPGSCRANLKNLYVRYDHPDRRGYGGKSSIILDGSVSDGEFVGLLTHECGHIIHASLPGTPASGWSGFSDSDQRFFSDSPIPGFFTLSWQGERVQRKGAGPKDFASGYARTDAFEDFAEFFTAYMLHPNVLAARAKTNDVIRQKLTWMQQTLPRGESIGRSLALWTGKIPWDATKMAMKLPTPVNVLTANLR